MRIPAFLRRLPLFACFAVAICGAFFAAAALADGCPIPRIEHAKAEMADQRAIIHHDAEAQVETLVIDTRIQPVGKGEAKGEYAWVVPLPNVPTKVEPGTAGMFDTAAALSAPDIVSEDREWGFGVAFGCWLTIYLVLLVFKPLRMLVALGVAIGFAGLLFVGVMYADAREGTFLTILGLGVGGLLLWGVLARRWLDPLVVFFLVFPLLLPVMGAASKGVAAAAAGSSSSVTLHRQELIGAYDTAVLTSPDGAALTEWLGKNGYPMPKDTAPVVAQLAKEGWCFVAMRLHEALGAAVHPHPMAFVFPAKQAVYPMRLTGAGQNSPLSVDLFVCGKQEAVAEGFKTECAVPLTPISPWRNADESTWRWVDGTKAVPWVHPGLRQFIPRAETLTWLHGVVAPTAMGRDIVIGGKPCVPYRATYHSAGATWEKAILAGFFTAWALAIAAAVLIRLKRWRWLVRLLAGGAVGIVLVVAGVRLGIPTIEVQEDTRRLAWRFGYDFVMAQDALSRAQDGLSDGSRLDAAQIRAALVKEEQRILAEESPRIRARLGLLFPEGDSPYTYAIREEEGETRAYYHNGIGQEFQIWPEPKRK